MKGHDMSPQRLCGLGGSMCLLATPLKNGRFDADAFAFLCERQIERGTTALVPLGIYSEAAALDRLEQARAVKLAVEVARGRVPVIAGGGVNYTSIAVDLAQQAERLGADGLLNVVPYYDRSSQYGLFHHFQEIQAAVGIPVIVCDVPSHTGVSLAADTILQLAELPRSPESPIPPEMSRERWFYANALARISSSCPATFGEPRCSRSWAVKGAFRWRPTLLRL